LVAGSGFSALLEAERGCDSRRAERRSRDSALAAVLAGALAEFLGPDLGSSDPRLCLVDLFEAISVCSQ
jgi:hypothetical protein